MAFRKLPSVEYLRQIFEYDSVNGWLIWRKRPKDHFFSEKNCIAWNRDFASLRAGSFTKLGYRTVRINDKAYCEHRIIWSYFNGSDPEGEIDHIDGNPMNNRIENMRVVTKNQQMWNTRGWLNRDLPKGIVLHKQSGRFRARIYSNGKQYHLGYFSTAREAHAAYRDAAVQLNGEFANAGK